MKYMLLIYHDEQRWNAMSEPEREDIYLEYRSLREDLTSRGKFLGGSQLQTSTTASSIRVRDESPLVTDGPFAETHEQLGGYFLIEANDRDEAIAIGVRIPSARMGTVEVRQLV
ncbi:MAG TPA: YciI family protein [Blastocatellia bacterium]|nr:YciI family protein [Blastocatellia bacterium]